MRDGSTAEAACAKAATAVRYARSEGEVNQGILHDEPTKLAIWTENQARTMRVNGRMMLAMTWPDDPSIPVDWIFDEIYEKAQPGAGKSPHHDWIELSTRANRNLDQRR